jgi:hypothetical protein
MRTVSGVFIEQHQVGGVMGDNAVDIAQDTIQHFVEIECASSTPARYLATQRQML